MGEWAAYRAGDIIHDDFQDGPGVRSLTLHCRQGAAARTIGVEGWVGEVRIAGVVVVSRISPGEGGRRIRIKDERFTVLTREVDENVGALRQTQQEVKGTGRIDRVSSRIADKVQWARDAIGVHCHCRQETALSTDLVHRRAGYGSCHIRFKINGGECLGDLTGATGGFLIEVQVPEPGLGGVKEPEPESSFPQSERRVGSAVDHGCVGKELGDFRYRRKRMADGGWRDLIRAVGPPAFASGQRVNFIFPRVPEIAILRISSTARNTLTSWRSLPDN